MDKITFNFLEFVENNTNKKVLDVWDVPQEPFNTDASDIKPYLAKEGEKHSIDNDPLVVGVDATPEEADRFHDIASNSEAGAIFFVRYVTKPKETLDDIFNSLPKDLQNYVKPTFDEAKKHITHCSEYNICWIGNFPGLPKVTGSFRHIHPRYTSERHYNISLTSLIPIVIKNEITEKLSMQWTDYTMKSISEYNRNFYKWFFDQMELVKQSNGPIEYISFPELGKIRYVKFNSTNYIHWTENLTNNIYLVSLFEDAKFK